MQKLISYYNKLTKPLRDYDNIINILNNNSNNIKCLIKSICSEKQYSTDPNAKNDNEIINENMQKIESAFQKIIDCKRNIDKTIIDFDNFKSSISDNYYLFLNIFFGLDYKVFYDFEDEFKQYYNYDIVDFLWDFFKNDLENTQSTSCPQSLLIYICLLNKFELFPRQLRGSYIPSNILSDYVEKLLNSSFSTIKNFYWYLLFLKNLIGYKIDYEESFDLMNALEEKIENSRTKTLHYIRDEIFGNSFGLI